MAAAALPALVSVGASLAGKKLGGPTRDQQTALAGTQRAAGSLDNMPEFGQAGTQLDKGDSYLQSAGNYYRQILGGRAGMRQALAPETSSIMDFYRGNAGKIDRSFQGGARDYAAAENDRARVGSLAGIIPTARANAAQGAERVAGGYGGLASGFTNLGGARTNTATGIGYLQSLVGNQANAQAAQAGGTGNVIGRLIFDALSTYGGGKGKGSTLPAGHYAQMPGYTGPSITGSRG